MVTNPDLTDGGDREGDSPVAADLVTRAGNGDKQAWDALVERYSPLIWSICRRRGLSDADAQDVGRSVWLRLVSQLETICVPAALPGWLAATTRRECGRILRVVPGARDTGHAGDARAIPDDHAPAAEEELLRAELHAALREALMHLPLCCQQLITLLAQNPPLSDSLSSTMLGIPVGSIGSHRGRCLDKLRRHPSLAALIDPGATTVA
jgi:RNA polymerase sigma factor (sigma-70 family)